MMELVTLGLLFGITGSLHCVGMCGPIALALPLNRTSTFTRIISILFYNIGRVATYSVIGALFGLFGKGFQLAGVLQVVSITLGVIMMVIVPSVMKKAHFTNKMYMRLNTWVNAKIGGRLQKKSKASLFVLGLLNGLLPCGLIFFAVGSSIIQGEAIKGALFMVFFGIGTIPALFLIAFFSETFKDSFRKKLRKAIPFVMILFGMLFILRGLNLGVPYLSPEFNKTGTEVKSCCHGSSAIKN